MSEILYAMLIGALSALLISAIIGIPKLIIFIVKKLKDKRPQIHLNKRTIIIALSAILGIAVIVSMVALIRIAPAEEPTEEIEYTITFYNNNGIYFYNTTAYGERMVIKYQDNSVYKAEKFSGGYPSEPTPPKNGEYVFLGWYKNPECTDKFLFGQYEVNGDINLYAKWGQKSLGYN